MTNKQINYISLRKRLLYVITFMHNGILLNPIRGIIRYIPIIKKCKCKNLLIMRHGKTVGVENHEFMSNTSINSRLSEEGKNDIRKIAKQVEEYKPDVVIVSTLSRTMDTFEVLKTGLSCEYSLYYNNDLMGINNGNWGDKSFESLNEDQLYVFLKRECAHNVLIRAQGGDSWADVIYRSIKLISFINKHYPNKKILLISQGSVYQALKIVLHLENSPWGSYSALKMFNIKKVSFGDNIGYSCLYKLK